MKVAYRPYAFGGTVKWKEIKGATTKDAMKWIREDLEVYDCDNSGDTTEYFAVKNNDGTYEYFVVKHSWWWEDWFTENRHVQNEYEFTKVTKEEAAIPDDRDWLSLNPTSNMPINWPPKTK